eukprot:SAG31_NODE_820_length_11808_cov_16.331540_16_plen_68_part_00
MTIRMPVGGLHGGWWLQFARQVLFVTQSNVVNDKTVIIVQTWHELSVAASPVQVLVHSVDVVCRIQL